MIAKRKATAAETYRWRNTLCQFTNGDFSQLSLVSNGLHPQETPVATLHQAYRIKWLKLSPRLSSPMQIAERCTAKPVRPHLTQSCLCLTKFIYHIQYMQSYKLHSYIHTYIHTSILSQHMHNINSHMIASVTRSLVWPYPFISVPILSCFKWLTLTNEHLAITFSFLISDIPVCLVKKCHRSCMPSSKF